MYLKRGDCTGQECPLVTKVHNIVICQTGNSCYATLLVSGFPCEERLVTVELSVAYNLCLLLLEQPGQEVINITTRTLERGEYPDMGEVSNQALGINTYSLLSHEYPDISERWEPRHYRKVITQTLQRGEYPYAGERYVPRHCREGSTQAVERGEIPDTEERWVPKHCREVCTQTLQRGDYPDTAEGWVPIHWRGEH